MLYYLPQPRYAERWTEYISGQDGIFETELRARNIQFKAIRPSNELHHISTGVVLDPEVMCRWGFAQTYTLVKYIIDGKVKEGDIIHFEDFWHPGMEMIPYTLSLKGLYGKVKLSACWFAQSVDPNDFTAKLMLPWIRAFETSWALCLDYIFVASHDLRNLMIDGAIPVHNVHITGLMASSTYLRKTYDPMSRFEYKDVRRKRVVYSSRLDEEKDPQFLCQVIEETGKLDPEILFVICTAATELRGHKESIDWLIEQDNVDIQTNLTKADYYEFLCASAVQFNCAKQDFVSNTLLEATTFGCTPFYPHDNPSFRDALGNSWQLLYSKTDGPAYVAKRLVTLVNRYAGKRVTDTQGQFAFVYHKYDQSIKRMFQCLGLLAEHTVIPLELHLASTQQSATLFDMVQHG